jgi:hypothetical protein
MFSLDDCSRLDLVLLTTDEIDSSRVRKKTKLYGLSSGLDSSILTRNIPCFPLNVRLRHRHIIHGSFCPPQLIRERWLEEHRKAKRGDDCSTRSRQPSTYRSKAM